METDGSHLWKQQCLSVGYCVMHGYHQKNDSASGRGETMQFDPVKRCTYQINPLKEVICQVRYPALLRIGDGNPTIFHEKIRAEFPYYYEPKVEHHNFVESNDTESTYPDTRISHADTPNHEFLSKDRAWKVNLTTNFVSLSTLQYKNWEDFKGRFTSLLSALDEAYGPSFFNRIGLRYIDAIDREELGLGNKKWSDLLRNPVLGMLSIEDDDDGIKVSQNSQMSELALDESHYMTVRTGMGTLSEGDGANRPVFVIDTDAYKVGDTETGRALLSLEQLHEPVSRYFRWAITDTLHEAMKPIEVI